MNNPESCNQNRNETDNDDKKKKSKVHKSDDHLALLKRLYIQFEGKWNDQFFMDLQEQTGISKKKLKKWFWDMQNKER